MVTKKNKTIKFVFEDKLSLLLFIFVSFGYPSLSDTIIPILIGISFLQFYRALKNKISFSFLIKTYVGLLVYSLIFYRSVHTAILIFTILFCLYYFFKNKAYTKKINGTTEISILLFFGCIVLNNIIFQYNFNVDTFLYLLFYPILFFFLKKINIPTSISKMMQLFVVSIFIASLQLFLINAINGTLLLKTHTTFSKYLGITHVYYGMSIGVACSFLLILFNWEKEKVNKKISLFLIAIFFGLLLYIGARISFVAVLLITGFFVLKRFQRFSIKQKILVTLFFLSFFVIFYNNSRVQGELNNIKKMYVAIKNNDKKHMNENYWKNVYIRYSINKSAINLLKDNMYIGVGLGNIKRKIKNKIRENGYKVSYTNALDNQYLYILTGMGVFVFCFL